MLRINQLTLPLDHTEQQLNDAVLALLGIQQEQLLSISVFKRGYDARQKNNIKL